MGEEEVDPKVAEREKILKQLEEDEPDYASEIPPAVLHSLQSYVAYGHSVGHFLTAVLEDRLFDAVCRADENSLRGLRPLIHYIYNRLPSLCWGSPEARKAWHEKGGILGGATCLSTTSTSSTSTD